MKKVLLVVGLMVSMSGFAQSVTWVTKPRTQDTIGYINLEQHKFVITHPVTHNEFKQIVSSYGTSFDIVDEKGKINIPKRGINPSTIQPNVDTNVVKSRGSYLVKAGQYKNAAIAVAGATTGLSTIILSNPANTIQEYRSKTTLAGLISLFGGGISLGLNIAGNNMLIKAGLATQP
jgi:hypothetical protein